MQQEHSESAWGQKTVNRKPKWPTKTATNSIHILNTLWFSFMLMLIWVTAFTIFDCLEKSGVERGSARWSSLKEQERERHRQLDEHLHTLELLQKQHWGNFWETGLSAYIYGFFKYTDTILNWIELPLEFWVISASNYFCPSTISIKWNAILSAIWLWLFAPS